MSSVFLSGRSWISLLALALGLCMQSQLDAATRSTALNVSITIFDSCSVQSVPSLAAEEFERLFSTGQTSGTVMVRCSQATPFRVGWEQNVTSQGEAKPGGAPEPARPDPLPLQPVVVPEPAVISGDTPSRLAISALPAGQAFSATPDVEQKPQLPTQPMIIVTF
jgi:hypothetical protein